MDNATILHYVKKAFNELDNIPEFTDIDFTGEADQLIHAAYDNLDKAIVRLRDLIKREAQNESD